ncbi:hypothetical protein HD806DRAFT_12997 [Xylariaceae sp. AK1471]|nr:hypothetical protein HD806DRAFT_12997 [Xylariaceae sp. AK1471]
MTILGIPPRSSSFRSHHKMDNTSVRPMSLYNGISNRSRGWKTKKFEKAPELTSTNTTVMRWDGASRSSMVWDNLKRDPELWFRDGNCYVYLHSEGQSHRGPAFRLPYSVLLDANCQPLIDNFMSRTHLKSNKSNRNINTNDANYLKSPTRRQRIELFIPAPPQSDKSQSYKYHLATRNFFAFIFRRSMVGETLGSALITLMRSLHQFRALDADNVQDLMSYMAEEGYLDLNGQPTHALAILRLAEVFQLRSLYIDAFAHCCGMSDQLFLVCEYQLLSSVTRKLIRRARLEMDSRLGKASNMLKTFLHDELHEANMELHPGAQAHLERFRTLLHGLYAVQFGYYPPPSIDPETTIFEADVFRTMRNDFEALYEFLVDEDFEISQTSPFLFLVDENFNVSQASKFLAQGGICTLQSIKSFDTRYDYETVSHPIPLLPEVPQGKSPPRRVSWWNKPTKADQSQRGNTLAALSMATNSRHLYVVKNPLVRAYRKFENDSISSPIKADKLENLGPTDGRKVRWILIYAIYQTLRQVTEVPAEVRDVIGVPYHLCVSTADLPPWKEEQPVSTLVRSQSGQITRYPSTVALSSLTSSPLSSPSLEIKPDIDYYALTHQAALNTKERNGSTVSMSYSFKDSFIDSVSRKYSTVRRSFDFFTEHEIEEARLEAHKSPYHGIAVRGYGSGMNSVFDNTEPVAEITPSDIAQTLDNKLIVSSASEISYSSSSYSNSEAGSSDTSGTSVTGSPIQLSVGKWERACDSVCTRCGHHDCDTTSSSSRRSISLHVEACPSHATNRVVRFEDEESCVHSRQRPMNVHLLKELEPAPLSISKVKTFTPDLGIQTPSPQAPTAGDYIDAVMEIQASNDEYDVHPEWEQFVHIGGLVELGSEPPRHTSTPAFKRALMI